MKKEQLEESSSECEWPYGIDDVFRCTTKIIDKYIENHDIMGFIGCLLDVEINMLISLLENERW